MTQNNFMDRTVQLYRHNIINKILINVYNNN